MIEEVQAAPQPIPCSAARKITNNDVRKWKRHTKGLSKEHLAKIKKAGGFIYASESKCAVFVELAQGRRHETYAVLTIVTATKFRQQGIARRLLIHVLPLLFRKFSIARVTGFVSSLYFAKLLDSVGRDTDFRVGHSGQYSPFNIWPPDNDSSDSEAVAHAGHVSKKSKGCGGASTKSKGECQSDGWSSSESESESDDGNMTVGDGLAAGPKLAPLCVPAYNLTFSVKVNAKESKCVQTGLSHKLLFRSQQCNLDQLSAILVEAVPRFEKVFHFESNPTNAALSAIFYWALHKPDNKAAGSSFHNLLRTQHTRDMKLSRGGVTGEYSPDTLQWFKAFYETAKGNIASRCFQVEFTNISKAMAAMQTRKRKQRTRNQTRNAVLRYKKGNEVCLLEEAVYSVALDFHSRQAKLRQRKGAFERKQGATRDSIKSVGRLDTRMVVEPTLQKVDAAVDKLFGTIGIVEDVVVGLTKFDKVVVAKESECASWKSQGIKEIGVYHDYTSWLACVIRVMENEGRIKVDLTGPEDHDPQKKGPARSLGRYANCFMSLWADGTDISKDAAGLAGWWLNDTTQKLIVGGISYAVPAAFYKGGEALAIGLLESQTQQFGSNEFVRVEFPEYNTYLQVKMPLQLLAGDHAYLCKAKGNMPSSSHRRLHFLRCLPIQLANDLALYQASGLRDHLEMFVRTLHNTLTELQAHLACPVKMFGTIGNMVEWLQSNNHSVPANKKRAKQPSKEDAVAAVRAHWPTPTHAEVVTTLTTQTFRGREFTAAKARSIHAGCTQATGVNAAPIFTPNNPSAFRTMMTVSAELASRATIPDITASASFDWAPAKKHLRTLLAIDTIVAPAGRSFTLRSDPAQLETWFQNGAPAASATDVDIDAVHVFIGIDHNAKAIGKMFIDGVVLKNKKAGQLQLTKEKTEALRKAILQQMGCVGFCDYVYGYHWERALHSVTETFKNSHECIVTLGLFLAESNLYKKRTARPNAADDRPEMRSQIVRDGDTVTIVPDKPCPNDLSNISMQFGVQLIIPTLFAHCSGVDTRNTYCASQRQLPFIMRDLPRGYCPAHGSDYRGEGIVKEPKYFLRGRHTHFTVRAMRAAAKARILGWARRFRRRFRRRVGPLTQKQGDKHKDENFATPPNTAIFEACMSELEVAGTRGNTGAFVDSGKSVTPAQATNQRSIPPAFVGGGAPPQVPHADDGVDGDSADEEEPALEEAAPSQYQTLKFDELCNDMYVQVQWEGQWYGAFVTGVDGTTASLLYPPNDGRSDTISTESGDDEELGFSRADAAAGIVRRPLDGNGVIPTQGSLAQAAPTVTPPSIVHSGATHHDSVMRSIAGYDANTGSAMGQVLTRTVREQICSNRDVSCMAAEKIAHGRYVYQAGKTKVWGQGAITQELLRELRPRTMRAESTDGLDDGALARAYGAEWQSRLECGTYAVIIGTHMLKLTVKKKRNAISGTTQTWAKGEDLPEGETRGFAVQVSPEAWARLVTDNNLTAAMSAVTNGAPPLVGCVCALGPCAQCHKCGDRAISATQVSEAVGRHGIDDAAAPNAPWTGLGAYKKARVIVRDCIDQQIKMHTHADADGRVKYQRKYLAGVWPSPTGTTVHTALLRDLGPDWLKNVQLDGTAGVQRVGDELLLYLREATGKNTQTQLPRLLALMQDKLKGHVVKDMTFYTGQKVDAQWTTGTGGRGNSAWQKRYKGREGLKGKEKAYGYNAEIVDYDARRRLYRVYYTADQKENCNVSSDFMRVQEWMAS